MKEETDLSKTASKAEGIRKLPQYITDQLLGAIDNVRAKRMTKSEMAFEQCSINVYRVGEVVRVDLKDKVNGSAPDAS